MHRSLPGDLRASKRGHGYSQLRISPNHDGQSAIAGLEALVYRFAANERLPLSCLTTGLTLFIV
jgi:hypothetical protein